MIVTHITDAVISHLRVEESVIAGLCGNGTSAIVAAGAAGGQRRRLGLTRSAARDTP